MHNPYIIITTTSGKVSSSTPNHMISVHFFCSRKRYKYFPKGKWNSSLMCCWTDSVRVCKQEVEGKYTIDGQACPILMARLCKYNWNQYMHSAHPYQLDTSADFVEIWFETILCLCFNITSYLYCHHDLSWKTVRGLTFSVLEKQHLCSFSYLLSILFWAVFIQQCMPCPWTSIAQ